MENVYYDMTELIRFNLIKIFSPSRMRERDKRDFII